MGRPQILGREFKLKHCSTIGSTLSVVNEYVTLQSYLTLQKWCQLRVDQNIFDGEPKTHPPPWPSQCLCHSGCELELVSSADSHPLWHADNCLTFNDNAAAFMLAADQTDYKQPWARRRNLGEYLGVTHFDFSCQASWGISGCAARNFLVHLLVWGGWYFEGFAWTPQPFWLHYVHVQHHMSTHTQTSMGLRKRR